MKIWNSNLDRNILKEDLRSFKGGMLENRELGWIKSNISLKKEEKLDKEVLEVE